jgi:hypothetical protein
MSTSTKRLRCGVCGTKTPFSNFTQEEVTEWCEICRYHLAHAAQIDFHPRCALCLAGFWQTRVNALRILILRPSALRRGDL